GAGFGRTGTLSLKSALEKIGFGPCYHMLEVFSRPEHVKMWHQAAFGHPVDWDRLFEGFFSTVDWPGWRWWRELAERYPEGKVLLGGGPAEAWYKSMTDTIYQPMKLPVREDLPELARLQSEMVRKAILTDVFDDRFEDKDHAIAAFNRNIEEVRRAIPPSRLLEFDVREGWEPLCRFLGVPVPADPFPRLNDTASAQAMIRHLRESNFRAH